MKKLFSIIAAICLWLNVFAQGNFKYVDATSLNIIGKLEPTPQPYHRVDSAKFHGFTDYQLLLLRQPVGMKICFKTNSKTIAVKASYAFRSDNPNTTIISKSGFDLHIKDQGKWIYAASGASKDNDPEKEIVLIKNMSGDMHECILYLPILSELKTLQIGVDSNAEIESIENPFRRRIAFFGSSFMHGISTNRAGMSVPMQLERNTGLHFISLAVSGNSKLQQSFARLLAAADVDAIVIDAFSNPSAKEIEERMIPFITTIRAAHPYTPIIFLQTIYRERGNFDIKARKVEEDKREMARIMTKTAQQKFTDIYFIEAPTPTGTDHLTSTDGTHPSDLGYFRWANAIQPKIVKILKKYDIR